ncbi:UDP-2,3-diacylglucosamine diphosphatase [Aquabacterium sp.]|uniref:UDP-2,3-diacylglucosamine diphosphatase n=1 Tax=Aquabacterium sp. TaxID=1872578 RepID=UPI002E2F5047|nr:UDP-2,3-diacylglucosamine diphosphatase [Aquabacterium sp.]HEX5310926.1 UDP-2,3-diacylglucosamine diphosphatase [Aquabacterium sp.]
MPNGKLPFPSYAGHLSAPPSWRCIDFISDIHLDPDLPKTTACLAQYLRTTPADAVLILGDLFEAWIGDDVRFESYESQCVDMLANAGRRLYLGIMVGNRDFLVGSELVTACHAHALQDPTVLRAWNQTCLLMHGDELCLADTSYLQFRSQVRQTAWQERFLAQPLPQRQAAANQMRQASQMHQKSMAQTDWADVDEATAGNWMTDSGAQCLVHGHTHRPRTESFGPGVRHVLSDWDLDHTSQPRAQVLRWTEVGFNRIDLAT